MKNDNKLKIAIVINSLIVFLVLLGLYILANEIEFMSGYDFAEKIPKASMLKYFTIESNIFMGVMALVFIIDEISLLKGKIKDISKIKYILKLASTSAVALTCVVVFIWLGPTTKGGIHTMLMNSNLFFHLIVPILSVLVFTIFEKTIKIPFKATISGLIILLLYGFVYMPDVITHMNNGKISTKYDFYNYFQNGILIGLIAFTVQGIIMYIISLSLWKLNKENK